MKKITTAAFAALLVATPVAASADEGIWMDLGFPVTIGSAPQKPSEQAAGRTHVTPNVIVSPGTGGGRHRASSGHHAYQDVSGFGSDTDGFLPSAPAGAQASRVWGDPHVSERDVDWGPASGVAPRGGFAAPSVTRGASSISRYSFGFEKTFTNGAR